jgi:hypothetical protein
MSEPSRAVSAVKHTIKGLEPLVTLLRVVPSAGSAASAPSPTSRRASGLVERRCCCHCNTAAVLPSVSGDIAFVPSHVQSLWQCLRYATVDSSGHSRGAPASCPGEINSLSSLLCRPGIEYCDLIFCLGPAYDLVMNPQPLHLRCLNKRPLPASGSCTTRLPPEAWTSWAWMAFRPRHCPATSVDIRSVGCAAHS